MKTYCKGVDPSDVISIEPFVYEALMTKLKRKDYSEFVARYCGIDMMGYVITAKGKIRIRPRVFIRARRAYMRAAAGDLRPKITRRVSAYYGFFKAAGIRRLRRPRPAKGAADQFVSVHAMQFMASMLTSKEDKEVLLCAA